MKSQRDFEGSSLYSDSIWSQARNSILRQYIDTEKLTQLNDQVLIQQQNYLMEEIKQKIKRSRAKETYGSMQILPIDSSISNISSAYNFGDDESLIKNKFTQQFQSSMVNSALKEVKANCSDQAYETIRNYVINNKQKQCENLTKTLQKKNKEIEEMSLSIIMKQNQLAKLKEEIAPYIAKVQFFQEQKKKWKKKNDQNTEKEMILHKMQRNLIFKEKMLQEAKKRAEKLKQFYDGIYSKMKKIQDDLNALRISIQKSMQKIQATNCCNEVDRALCWKKQVMKKFRQKLLEERGLLKEEQKHLQKRYEMLQMVSDQCKKLVNQSYEGVYSNISGAGNSNLNSGIKEQKAQKIPSFSVISPPSKRLQL